MGESWKVSLERFIRSCVKSNLKKFGFAVNHKPQPNHDYYIYMVLLSIQLNNICIYSLDGSALSFTSSPIFSEPQKTKETIAIFTGALSNAVDWGDGPIMKPATSSVNENKVTVTGNLIDYGTFPNATLTITLTPYSAGGTNGLALFDEQESGTDNDGININLSK